MRHPAPVEDNTLRITINPSILTSTGLLTKTRTRPWAWAGFGEAYFRVRLSRDIVDSTGCW
jgi:hypothetical protein